MFRDGGRETLDYRVFNEVWVCAQKVSPYPRLYTSLAWEETETLPDIATITAILYAARLSRRVPETVIEKHRTIAESYADAMLIVAGVQDRHEADDIRSTLARLLEADPPEQPPPSPGNKTGVLADAKATRRRG